MCSISDRNYANGTIIVWGINTTDSLVGRIEIYVGTEWWAVCDDGWDSDDASGVCGQLGFTECKLFNPTFTQLHSNIVFPARDYGNSCFGKNEEIRQFQCAGSDCSMFTRDDDIITCRNDAGIECSKYIEHNYKYLL